MKNMDINLNINAPGLCEALNNLASALVGMGSNAVATVENPAPARKPRGSKPTDAVGTTAETIQEEVKTADPVVEKTAEVVQADAPKVEAPKFTLEQVRAKLTELSKNDANRPKIKELFGKFGAGKLTEVPEANYAELMAAAEEIG